MEKQFLEMFVQAAM